MAQWVRLSAVLDAWAATRQRWLPEGFPSLLARPRPHRPWARAAATFTDRPRVGPTHQPAALASLGRRASLRPDSEGVLHHANAANVPPAPPLLLAGHFCSSVGFCVNLDGEATTWYPALRLNNPAGHGVCATARLAPRIGACPSEQLRPANKALQRQQGPSRSWLPQRLRWRNIPPRWTILRPAATQPLPSTVSPTEIRLRMSQRSRPRKGHDWMKPQLLTGRPRMAPQRGRKARLQLRLSMFHAP